MPATLLPPDTTDTRKTATRAWSKAETERRRHAAATQPALAPIDAFPDEYSTADDLAAVRLDADPNATGPPYGATKRPRLANRRNKVSASGCSPSSLRECPTLCASSYSRPLAG